jgi:hypothetical protein
MPNKERNRRRTRRKEAGKKRKKTPNQRGEQTRRCRQRLEARYEEGEVIKVM